MLLVAAAIPRIQSLGQVPILALECLEGLGVLLVDAQILLHAPLSPQAEEATEGVRLRAAQIAADAVVVGVAEAPALEAHVHGHALPIPRLRGLDFLELCLQFRPLARLEGEAVGLGAPSGRKVLRVELDRAVALDDAAVDGPEVRLLHGAHHAVLGVGENKAHKGRLDTIHLIRIADDRLNVVEAHALRLHGLLEQFAEGALAVEGAVGVEAGARGDASLAVALGTEDVDHDALDEILYAKGLAHGDLLVAASGEGGHRAGAVSYRVPHDGAAELRGLGLGVLGNGSLTLGGILAALENDVWALLELQDLDGRLLGLEPGLHIGPGGILRNPGSKGVQRGHG